MGLTFHHEFQLPSTWTSSAVDQVLAKLRCRAEELRFEHITPIYEGVADGPSDERHDILTFFAEGNAEPLDDERRYTGDEDSVRGFLAWPGPGCEPASFAFMRRTFDDDASTQWFWYGWCKTQYASNHGEQNFLDCHVRLVDIMDYAKQLGIEVSVFDEGDYWETRDRSVLLRNLDTMNRLIARVAGQIHDLGHRVESPIFDRRDYERLEG